MIGLRRAIDSGGLVLRGVPWWKSGVVPLLCGLLLVGLLGMLLAGLLTGLGAAALAPTSEPRMLGPFRWDATLIL